MLVLSINSGSSSIKYSVIDVSSGKALLRGIVENIGLDSILKQNVDNNEIEIREFYSDHGEAIQKIICMLTHPEYGVVSDLESIFAVGHRVAHGGEKLFKASVINDFVLKMIKENTKLAPLHMPHMVRGIEEFMRLLPGKPMVAVFDTAFHQTMPEKAYLYAIPYEYYFKYGIRRYGFHGTSHKYVSKQAAILLGKPYETMKIISCHLGNGSSVTAIERGRSVDTSMGFTPLPGVPMGTRCGDIDPAIIGFLIEHESLTYKEVEEILNMKSGFLGLSGHTSDCRKLEALIQKGDKRAITTIENFCYSIKKYIGAYSSAMNGVDCIVFTGGIGENSSFIRENICRDMEYLGIQLDIKKNNSGIKNRKRNIVISDENSKVTVCKINTNEELMIGYETLEAINQNREMESIS